MERLIPAGHVKAIHSSQVGDSPIGLGFEKLDRGVFDPEKAYDRVAELGVKWIRIKSGWPGRLYRGREAGYRPLGLEDGVSGISRQRE
jgi:hypothetical protein